VTSELLKGLTVGQKSEETILEPSVKPSIRFLTIEHSHPHQFNRYLQPTLGSLRNVEGHFVYFIKNTCFFFFALKIYFMHTAG
jgi:hypothetical protein